MQPKIPCCSEIGGEIIHGQILLCAGTHFPKKAAGIGKAAGCQRVVGKYGEDGVQISVCDPFRKQFLLAADSGDQGVDFPGHRARQNRGQTP